MLLKKRNQNVVLSFSTAAVTPFEKGHIACQMLKCLFSHYTFPSSVMKVFTDASLKVK